MDRAISSFGIAYKSWSVPLTRHYFGETHDFMQVNLMEFNWLLKWHTMYKRWTLI